MIRHQLLNTGIASLAFLGTLQAVPFTAGNLAVLQATASVNNTTASIVEVSPSSITPATPVQSIAIDGTTASVALRFSGSATSTGYLTTTQSGSLLSFTGVNNTNTSANTNTLNPRGVGTFNPAGNFSLATTYTGTSGNQARSATSLNDINWFIGDQGGIYTNGTTAASPAANIRSVKSFGGTVYGLQNSSTVTNIAVSTISAPTGGTVTGLPGLTNNASTQDFHLISSGDNGAAFDVLYIVSATSNTAGSVTKFSLVSGTWTANGSYTTAFGGFGLAAADSGNGATLFVSTGQGALTANNLLKVTDTAGYNAAIAITTANNVTLYTAPAGNVIKGVSFAPVNSLPDLTVGVTAPADGTTGTNFDYTVTATNTGSSNATGVSVQFTLPGGLTYISSGINNGFTAAESAGVVTFSGGALNGGANAVLTVTVNTAAAGTYAAPVGAAIADPTNTVAESNESNNSSPAGTSTVVVTPNSPPFFTLQPAANSTVPFGTTTTLTVAASGNPTPTFQWYEGVSGTTVSPVAGATSASFTTPAITANTSYWVRASNGQGSPADSNTATITVQLSSTSTLSALVPGSGTLTPTFAPAATAYSVTVANSIASITVTPTASNAFATIQARVNGGAYGNVSSGSPSAALALNIGPNTVEILATSQDGLSTSLYIITVSRAAPNLSTGAIAFTGFNADGSDDIAFVALTAIPANSAIYFTDNEWNGQAIGAGGAFNDFGESEWLWTAPAGGLAAGTVVTINNLSATTTTSAGTVIFIDSSNRGLSGTAEAVYAFQGSSHTPEVFLAQISSDTAASIANTGLTASSTAVVLGSSSDGARYKGSRSNQTTFPDYLALIGNVAANWDDIGNGDGTTYLPFDTTAFLLGAPANATLSINDASVIEGNNGTATLSFTVSRNDNATAFTLDYATADGSANQPGDYTSTSGTLTFTAGGALTQPVTVMVQGDATGETDETVVVNLSNLVIVSGTTTLSDAQGVGSILNDDPVISTPFSSTNRNVLVPNRDTWPAAGVSLNGTQFVNLGLQGVGRVPANAIDPATGESLGSISDMQVTDFVNNQNGTWSGTFHFLPDRGYNSGALFSNYAARINKFSFDFTPYTAAAPTALQNQVAMSFLGSERFTYDHDSNAGSPPIFTTGLVANGGTSLFSTTIPVVTGATTQSDGTVTNRLTVDSEGLVLDTRSGKSGSGWVGDEYGAYIYHFNSSKQIDGQLQLPAALVPHSPAGTVNFQADPPISGRRINQGMEGLAQSPSGSKLFGLLQSATIQDSAAGNPGRFNTRLVVYDLSASDLPNNPVGQYVIQLPVADDTGSTTNGATVNRNCAQSSILALNDHQLLILSRDGNGRGASGSPVFKSILLADLSNASNFDGLYDAEGTGPAAVVSGATGAGILIPSVTPISWTEALNMLGKLDLNIAEVAKFGLNLNAGPGDINTISEKWEGLGLVSCSDAANPNDYFLFVGNDNDFQTATGKYMSANGTLLDYNAGLENDTVVLAYRVRFVQPLSPVNLWRQNNFFTTSTAGNLANNGDFDFDGIENLVEYGLGTNPTIGTGINGPSALPSSLLGDPDSLLSDRLALSFSIANPNPIDITYLVQATDNLGTWTDVARKNGAGEWTWLGGGISRIVTSGTGPVSVKIGDVVPSSGNPRRMMRLTVSEN